jgi:ribosomal protein S18 acetylase RimI-like enzyme
MPYDSARAEEDARRGHRNLITYCGALATWSEHGTCEGDAAVLLCAGGSWVPGIGNGAFRLHDSVPGAELVSRADAFFGALGRGYSVKVRDSGADDDLRDSCQEAGLVPLGDPAPEMVCRDRLPEPSPPAGVDLRVVTDPGGVADFAAVNGRAYATYGMPDGVHADLFSRPAAVLADDRAVIVVAHHDGQPVATALTFVSDGTASLQWVGTVPEARHLGLGRLVTIRATNAAFEMGAPSCTLQASVMGQPLYATLGYEVLFDYQDLVRWKPVPA